MFALHFTHALVFQWEKVIEVGLFRIVLVRLMTHWPSPLGEQTLVIWLWYWNVYNWSGQLEETVDSNASLHDSRPILVHPETNLRIAKADIPQKI